MYIKIPLTLVPFSPGDGGGTSLMPENNSFTDEPLPYSSQESILNEDSISMDIDLDALAIGMQQLTSLPSPGHSTVGYGAGSGPSGLMTNLSSRSSSPRPAGPGKGKPGMGKPSMGKKKLGVGRPRVCILNLYSFIIKVSFDNLQFRFLVCKKLASNMAAYSKSTVTWCETKASVQIVVFIY